MKRREKKPPKPGAKRFHPLRRQIAVLFIGLLLLSICAITVINGLFLEQYYISRKTDVLLEAIQTLNDLKLETDENPAEEIPDELRRKAPATT